MKGKKPNPEDAQFLNAASILFPRWIGLLKFTTSVIGGLPDGKKKEELVARLIQMVDDSL